MACSKLAGQNGFAKSEARFLGETEVEWEIIGWSGPLSHQMRSKASCLVSIPVDNGESSEIQLRFHLKPYQCHDALETNFCTRQNTYVAISTNCNCSTCALVPFRRNANIPLEFLPKTGTQSAGYSLLLDVLSSHDNLVFTVSMEKCNGQGNTASKQVVRVGSGPARDNLVVEQSFWRMLLWTVDKCGNIGNCRETTADTVEDARFRLTVTAYELTSTVADSTKAGATIAKDAEPSEIMKADNIAKITTNPALVDHSDLTQDGSALMTDNLSEKMGRKQPREQANSSNVYVMLLCLKGTHRWAVNANRATLIEKSAYFRRELEKCPAEILLNVDYDALQVVLIWMTYGMIPLISLLTAERVCDWVKNHLELDNSDTFWEPLEQELMTLCNSGESDVLLRLARKYNLSRLEHRIKTKDNTPVTSTIPNFTIPSTEAEAKIRAALDWQIVLEQSQKSPVGTADCSVC